MSKVPSILQMGAGYWGKNHLRVWKKLESEGKCKLVGVQALGTKNLQQVSKEYGVDIFTDDSGWDLADAIDVVSPTFTHYEFCKKAIKENKDIFVEKPIAESVEESRDLEKMISTSTSIVMVGHIFNYNPAVDKAKELIVQGKIGDVQLIKGQFIGFRNKESDAGIIATTAMHFVYLVNYFVDASPTAVNAWSQCILGSELEDNCLLQLHYKKLSASIEADFFSTEKKRTFMIIGTEGILEIDTLTQQVILHNKSHILKGGRYFAQDGGMERVETIFVEPLEIELRHFLDCIKERQSPKTGIGAAKDVLRVVEACYESAKSDGILVPL